MQQSIPELLVFLGLHRVDDEGFVFELIRLFDRLDEAVLHVVVTDQLRRE